MIPLSWALILKVLRKILLALKILCPGIKRLDSLKIVELLSHLFEFGLIRGFVLLLLICHLNSFFAAASLLYLLFMCLYLAIIPYIYLEFFLSMISAVYLHCALDIWKS